MDAALRKHYIRLIYSRTFRYLAAALVVCAIIGGIYGDSLHFVYALCAAGAVLLGWGWFSYLRLTGMRLFGFSPNREKKRVPYIHRRDKTKPPHQPAAFRDGQAFDDDLTGATAVDEEAFNEKQIGIARIIAKLICGVLLIILSFLVQI